MYDVILSTSGWGEAISFFLQHFFRCYYSVFQEVGEVISFLFRFLLAFGWVLSSRLGTWIGVKRDDRYMIGLGNYRRYYGKASAWFGVDGTVKSNGMGLEIKVVITTSGNREDARRLALGVYNGNKFPTLREVVELCAIASISLNSSCTLREGLVAFRKAVMLCLYWQESSDRGIVPNLLFVSFPFKRFLPCPVNLPGRPQPKPTNR